MAQGLLFQSNYRPLFSGHQTFPLRYGWLKKAYDAVVSGEGDKSVFLDASAIARFGVGKNMVGSIRHWATSCGVIAEASDRRLRTSPFGDLLFGKDGIDPYLEHPSSLWMLHWNLCSGDVTQGLKTTWYWSFNYFAGTFFGRDQLVEGIMKVAESRGWPRVSQTTVQRDVECFVRTYEGAPSESRSDAEESLDSVLSELGLVRAARGQFQFVRGPKRSLSTEVFVVALNRCWSRQPDIGSMSFESIAHEPGSPGRVFLLDETDLAERVLALEDASRGAYEWSETAGLRQVLRRKPISPAAELDLLRRAYEGPIGSRMAS